MILRIWLQISVHLCSVWRKGEEGEGGGKLLRIITCWGAGIHVCGGEVGEWVNSNTRVLSTVEFVCVYVCTYMGLLLYVSASVEYLFFLFVAVPCRNQRLFHCVF